MSQLVAQGALDLFDEQRAIVTEVSWHVTTVKAPDLLDGVGGIDYVRRTAEESRPILATIGRAKCEIAS